MVVRLVGDFDGAVQGLTGVHLRLVGWIFSKGRVGGPPPGEVLGGAGWGGFGWAGFDGCLGCSVGRRGQAGGWSVRLLVNLRLGPGQGVRQQATNFAWVFGLCAVCQSAGESVKRHQN